MIVKSPNHKYQEAVFELAREGLKGVGGAHLMNLAARLVAETSHASYSAVFENLSGTSSLILRAGVGWRSGLAGTLTVAAAPDSLPGFTLANEGLVIVDSKATGSALSSLPLFETHGVVASISATIPGTGSSFGVLSAHNTEDREFTNVDLQFLHCMAIALGQALAYDRALQRHDSYHRTVLDTLPDIIAIAEGNGMMTYINESVRRVSGFEPEELVGKTAFEFFHPKDIQMTLKKIQESLHEPGRIHEAEFRVADKRDGSWHILEARGRWFIDSDGKPRLLVEARERSTQPPLASGSSASRKSAKAGRSPSAS